jgi:hypothetical protein
MTFITRKIRGGSLAARFQAVLEVVDKNPLERIRSRDLQVEMFSQKKVCRTDSISNKCLGTFEEGH